MSLLTLKDSSDFCAGIAWPSLLDLRLDEPSLARRAAGVGGSDANIILSGDSDRIRRLWLEKRGAAQESDLSANLPAMLGCWTESFNRQWLERVTGQCVGRVGTAFQCQRHDWRRCTLDGFIEETEAVWEAKHTNAFANAEEVVERYMPQLQHNMAVVGADRAFLSVIFGNQRCRSGRCRPVVGERRLGPGRSSNARAIRRQRRRPHQRHARFRRNVGCRKRARRRDGRSPASYLSCRHAGTCGKRPDLAVRISTGADHAFRRLHRCARHSRQRRAPTLCEWPALRQLRSPYGHVDSSLGRSERPHRIRLALRGDDPRRSLQGVSHDRRHRA